MTSAQFASVRGASKRMRFEIDFIPVQRYRPTINMTKDVQGRDADKADLGEVSY